MMRIDDSRIPVGGSVKVRCPHCKGIEEVHDRTPSDQGLVSQEPDSWAGQPDRLPGGGSEVASSEAPSGPAQDHGEPTIPTDAFQNFRFPAEKDAATVTSRWIPLGTGRIFLWVAVSLAVVAIFALFVNILLPGPMGTKPFWGGDSRRIGAPPAVKYAPDVRMEQEPVIPPARR